MLDFFHNLKLALEQNINYKYPNSEQNFCQFKKQ